jgi:heat shock protein HslJ
MPTRTILTLAVLALVAASCSSSAKSSASNPTTTPTTAAPANPLTGTTWDLVTYRGDKAMKHVAASGGAYLTFRTGGQLSGSTGCNSFTGTYSASATALTIQLGAMTQVACPSDLTAQESAITKKLPKVTAYAIKAGVLTLTDAKDVKLFTYKAATTSLPGTSWKVTGVNNGNGAVSSTALTEKLTATFAKNDEFSGFGGCNHMSGPYKLTGTNGVTIGPLRSTLIACQGDVGELEAEYHTALSHVTNYEISGTTLTLRDKNNATQVTAQRA